MANPTQLILDDASAAALSDTVHGGTGILHIKSNVGPSDTPNLFTHLKTLEKNTFDLLAPMIAGAVVKLGGLNVGVFALNYRLGGDDYAFTGVATTALTASTITNLYLDSSATLKESFGIGNWPAGEHWKIAQIDTDASSITNILDHRWINVPIGGTSAWYGVAAASPVDFNNFGINKLSRLEFGNSVEETIAAGVIGATGGSIIRVDTEADAASDDLTAIAVTGNDVRPIVILMAENVARVVTVKNGASLVLNDGDFVLDTADRMIALMHVGGGTWHELFRNFTDIKKLTSNIDGNAMRIGELGRIGFGVSALTIAAGVIAITETHHTVLNEGGGATDQLDTINGGLYSTSFLILRGGNVAQVPTIKHGTGNILLANGVDYALASNDHSILLMWDGVVWHEISRSHWLLTHLVATGQVIPDEKVASYPGTLTNGQQTWHYLVSTPLKMKRARGYVGTAPSGGSCVVQIKKDGANVFAADANAINIADGTNEDVSDTVDVDFAIGQRMSVEVVSAFTAADLTVSIECYRQARVAS